MIKNFIDVFRRILQPYGKTSFIYKMKSGSKILDVGCGNDSAYRLKLMRPDCFYIGLDIDHDNTGNNQTGKFADEMFITSPEFFHEPIDGLQGAVDYIISSHNLEHCNDRSRILTSMIRALKVGGLMYLSFPSIQSQYFPRRFGPLNYYDEKEHILTPPDPTEVLEILEFHGCKVLFYCSQYQPTLLKFIGFLVEPLSKFKNRTLIGTWQLYGFETVFWIKKN